MSSQTHPRPTSSHFTEIPREQCVELLRSHSIGRVGWNSFDGPEVLPVTYAFYTGRVVFRTSPSGVLSRLVRRSNVAFEIDHIDHTTSSGWDVVVRGFAERVTEAYDLIELWKSDDLVPWATGTRNLFIGITPWSITGRRVKAPFAD
jgi:nitroimidazol reductase NimA-like FMN-containing flavoprotein (pyridoxamine 5'-phosphate oxidase superfamily)